MSSSHGVVVRPTRKTETRVSRGAGWTRRWPHRPASRAHALPMPAQHKIQEVQQGSRIPLLDVQLNLDLPPFTLPSSTPSNMASRTIGTDSVNSIGCRHVGPHSRGFSALLLRANIRSKQGPLDSPQSRGTTQSNIAVLQKAANAHCMIDTAASCPSSVGLLLAIQLFRSRSGRQKHGRKRGPHQSRSRSLMSRS